MRYIAREIAFLIIMLVHKARTKNLIMGFRAKADIHAKFEGNNKLSHHSYFSGEMGFASYIGAHSVVLAKVGRFCSIAENVHCLVYTHPIRTYVSTHPSFYSLKKQSGFTFIKEQKFNESPKLDDSNYSIEIGNDVYIGYGVTIVGPCRIGDGAVIAANSTVTKDVPDYTVVAGVPAKEIRKRFDDEDIDFLKRLKWWNRNEGWLRQHAAEFTDLAMLKEIVLSDEENDNDRVR